MIRGRFSLHISGILILLFISIQAGGQRPQIGNTPKKINLFEQEAYKPAPIAAVPKKVNLFDQKPLQKIKLKIRPADSNIKAPFELNQYENAAVFPELGEGLHFCGERLHQELPSVKSRLNREFGRYQRAKYSVKHYQARCKKYRPEILATLRKHGVPDEFLYLAVAESGLSNATSPKGAKGFWQFMPETAKNYGLEVSRTVDERLDPQKSADAACRYLLFLYRKFQSWTLAAAAYNMGEGGLENAIQRQGVKNYYQLSLNPETAQYLFRIVALKYIVEKPGKLGFESGNLPEKTVVKTRKETVDYHILSLSDFAEECGTDYETLKYLNPWLISDHLERKSGKIYEICLPVEETVAGND